jgi:hypothetical protein
MVCENVQSWARTPAIGRTGCNIVMSFLMTVDTMLDVLDGRASKAAARARHDREEGEANRAEEELEGVGELNHRG